METELVQVIIQSGALGVLIWVLWLNQQTIKSITDKYVEGRQEHERMHREEVDRVIAVHERAIERIHDGQEERTKAMIAVGEQMAVQSTIMQGLVRSPNSRTRQSDPPHELVNNARI